MFITPMTRLGGISELSLGNAVQPKANGAEFMDVFQTLYQNAYDTEKKVEENDYLLATGQIDDVHTLPIDATKAQLSLDLMIQIRNKALDAYNELMRLNM